MKRIVAVLLATGFLVGLVAGPVAAGSGGAVVAKKCKKKHGKRRCKKKSGTNDPGASGPLVAHLAISPTSHDFGNVVHNNYSASFAFTVTNTGLVTSQAPKEQYAGASGFLHVSSTCTSNNLSPGESCQVAVEFHAPAAPGTYSGTLIMSTPDDYSGGTVTAQLTGRST